MKSMKKAFTLLELLIVVVILAALTGLISPSFARMETLATENADKYNMAGVLRYVNMFKTANSVFPTNWHTGLGTDNATAFLTTGVPYNFAANILDDTDTVLTHAATGTQIDTLDAAEVLILEAQGFTTLVHGSANTAGVAINGATPAVASCQSTWTTEGTVSGGDVVAGATEITFDALTVAQHEAAGDAYLNAITGNAGANDSFALPLLLTPFVDWDQAWVAGVAQNSLVEMDVTPTSSVVADGELPYYTCIFLVREDDDAGVTLGEDIILLGVVSPRGISSNP